MNRNARYSFTDVAMLTKCLSFGSPFNDSHVMTLTMSLNSKGQACNATSDHKDGDSSVIV